jgi:hypothetical protein
MNQGVADVARIGNLNGKWSVLFRGLMALGAVMLPMMVSLNVWFVSSIYEMKIVQIGILARIDSFMGEGPRYTEEMARADHAELKGQIVDDVLNNYPPKWVTDLLAKHDKEIERINEELRSHN